MAKRYYIQFHTIGGTTWDVEIYDSGFGGGASEINGRFEGFHLNYDGDGDDIFSPILGSSVTFEMLIENAGHETFISDLAGASEGRFYLVIYRDSSLYWLGYLLADQVVQDDVYFPYTFSMMAVDGIARLADKDYLDPDTGLPFTGSETIWQHLKHCCDHIGLDSVVLWPAQNFKSNVNWFDAAMSTANDPLDQAEIHHDRFKSKDNDGNDKYFSVYEVLESICRLFGARFFYANGAYYFLQVSEFDDSSHITWNYNLSTGYLSKTSGINYDKDIDYLARFKETGGTYTYLKPLKKVIVDYHHLTHNNRAIGIKWDENNYDFETLPGPVTVDANDTSQIHCVFNFRIKSWIVVNPGAGVPYPIHRYKFGITIKIGTAYVDLPLIQSFPTTVYEPAEWTSLVFEIETYSPFIHEAINNQFIDFIQELSTDHLQTSMNGQSIEIKIRLILVEDMDGNPLVAGPNYIHFDTDWESKNNIVEVLEEGIGDNPDHDTVRHSAIDATVNNTSIYKVDTYLGDGPLPYSTSRLTVGGVDTTTWKISGIGADLPIAQLLAQEILAIRKTAIKVYRGVYIAADVHPYTRFVDNGFVYWAMRLSYSAFYDLWSGDFALIDRDTTNITTEEEGPIGPEDPGDPPFAPNNPNRFGRQVPLVVYGSGYIMGAPTALQHFAATTFNGSQTADQINLAGSITVDPVSYIFAAAGDQIKLINPITGTFELVTVATTYIANSATLELTTAVADDYPNGAYITPVIDNIIGVKFTQKNANFTGTDWTITAGTLPNPAVVGEVVIDRRVELWRSGSRVFYNVPNGFTIDFATNKIIFSFKCRDEVVFINVVA